MRPTVGRGGEPFGVRTEESRMRMREIPGIHGGDDDERRWRRTRDFQADRRRALTQPAEPTSSAAPV